MLHYKHDKLLLFYVYSNYAISGIPALHEEVTISVLHFSRRWVFILYYLFKYWLDTSLTAVSQVLCTHCWQKFYSLTIFCWQSGTKGRVITRKMSIIHINRAVLSRLSNVTIHSNKRTSGSIALLSTIWHYSWYHLFKEIKQTIKLHIHFGSDHIIKGGKMFNTIRTKYLKNTVPSQGPRHTKDVIKMVPVVPLFGNQH